MTVTSVGSSFSYIRPEAAARETAASSAVEETTEIKAVADTDDGGSKNPALDQATKAPVFHAQQSVSASVHAELVKAQETLAAPPSHKAASRAYGGH